MGRRIKRAGRIDLANCCCGCCPRRIFKCWTLEIGGERRTFCKKNLIPCCLIRHEGRPRLCERSDIADEQKKNADASDSCPYSLEGRYRHPLTSFHESLPAL